ncbi:MAG: hypothetical protein EOP39_26170, partial [Rubrivivax sp.]
MQILRRLHLLRHLAVLWFVCSVFAAGAAPLVNPVGFQIVCSGTTTKVVFDNGDTGDWGGEVSANKMDCALCLPVALPLPPVASIERQAIEPLAYITRSVSAARLAAVVAA